jgi:nitrite reductase/ring-hydroxylating ferredoxin subunit
MNRWFAVAACGEVPRGHIGRSQLLGQELVLWRTAAGVFNAWENRCPHRGVRLSLGICAGEELRCQYHAWRFASGTGQCTRIPSHPDQKPASTLRPAVFPVFEDGVFAWVNLARDAVLPVATPPGHDTALRSIFVRAPAEAVRQSLLQGYAELAVSVTDDFTFAVDELGLRLMLQPVTDDQAVLHARLQGPVDAEQRMAELRRHNGLMGAVRDRAERGA